MLLDAINRGIYEMINNINFNKYVEQSSDETTILLHFWGGFKQGMEPRNYRIRITSGCSYLWGHSNKKGSSAQTVRKSYE